METDFDWRHLPPNVSDPKTDVDVLSIDRLRSNSIVLLDHNPLSRTLFDPEEPVRTIRLEKRRFVAPVPFVGSLSHNYAFYQWWGWVNEEEGRYVTGPAELVTQRWILGL